MHRSHPKETPRKRRGGLRGGESSLDDLLDTAENHVLWEAKSLQSGTPSSSLAALLWAVHLRGTSVATCAPAVETTSCSLYNNSLAQVHHRFWPTEKSASDPLVAPGLRCAICTCLTGASTEAAARHCSTEQVRRSAYSYSRNAGATRSSM